MDPLLEQDDEQSAVRKLLDTYRAGGKKLIGMGKSGVDATMKNLADMKMMAMRASRAMMREPVKPPGLTGLNPYRQGLDALMAKMGEAGGEMGHQLNPMPRGKMEPVPEPDMTIQKATKAEPPKLNMPKVKAIPQPEDIDKSQMKDLRLPGVESKAEEIRELMKLLSMSPVERNLREMLESRGK